MDSHTSHFIGAVFCHANHAHAMVEEMIEHNFPMDRISILYKGGGHGDDILGIVYFNEKERMKVWGALGALLGSLGGLIAGAAGLGVGSELVAGPLIDGVTGAAIGTGLMAAGAKATHQSIAARRASVPKETLALLHQAIVDGKTLLLLNCGSDSPEFWRQRLTWRGADPVISMP